MSRPMERQRWKNTVIYLALLTGAVFMTGPVLFMVAGSLQPAGRVFSQVSPWQVFAPGSMNLHNYAAIIHRSRFGVYLLNSAIINGGIVLLGLGINSLAGYALARLRWRGRALVLSVVLALLVVPFEAIAVPLFYQLSVLGWRNTYAVQIAPFIASPLSIYMFYMFFLGFPREIEEAARVDGAGTLRTFVSVVVPNSKPVFAGVAIVTLLLQWGMYLWPLLMTTGATVRPLPLGIATFYTLPPLNWGTIMAFGVLMVSPVLVVFVVFQRWFIRSVATTGTKR